MTTQMRGIVELAVDNPLVGAPTWIDISTLASNIKIQRGRQDAFSNVDASSMSVDLSNLDGRFSVANSGSPYYPNLRKNNRIRVSIVSNAVTYIRYIGYVNEWPVRWNGKQAIATVTCSDIFKLLARHDISRGNYSEQALTAKPVAFYPMDETDPQKTLGNYSAVTNNPMQGSLKFNRAGRIGGSAKLGDQSAPDGGTGVAFTPTGGTHGDSFVTGPIKEAKDGGVLVQGNLQSPLPTDWAFDLWIKTDSIPVDTEMDVMNFNTTGRLPLQFSLAINSYTWRQALSGMVIVIQRTGDGSNPTALTFFEPVGAPAVVADGRLKMITVEWTNATHSLSLYVNGVLLGTTTAFSFPTGYQYVTLGGRDDQVLGPPTANTSGGLWLFTGVLSNFAVFNKANGSYNTPLSRFQAGTGWNGDDVGARITRLLQYCGVPSQMYNITTGSQLVGPQELHGKSLLDSAKTAAAVEDMPLYVAADGRVTFQPRTVRTAPTFTTIDARDCPGLQFVDDDAYLVNVVEVTGTSIGTQTVSNLDGGTSLTRYGTYKKPIDNLPLYTDQQGVDLARRLLARWADPPARLDQIQVEGVTQGLAGYANLLNTDINNGITVTNLPAQAPCPTSTYQCIVEGVDEDIQVNGFHTFTFKTSPITTADANEINNGDKNVWRLGVTGHNLLGTQTILDY